MSEATLQVDLQRELLRLTTLFSSGDVVINDWSILDQGNAKAPYINIETAEGFDATGAQSQWELVWKIPFMLIEKFTDWDETRGLIATHRSVILTALLETDKYLDASGLLAYGIREINGQNEVPIYDRYPEDEAESLPVFLGFRMSVTAHEIRRS
jgi:hypothetical protein